MYFRLTEINKKCKSFNYMCINHSSAKILIVFFNSFVMEDKYMVTHHLLINQTSNLLLHSK